jgi:hypothetical protein
MRKINDLEYIANEIDPDIIRYFYLSRFLETMDRLMKTDHNQKITVKLFFNEGFKRLQQIYNCED